MSSVNVVSILGAGHSGSTLLDMVCGTLPSVFSMGEVEHFAWQVWRDGGMCELGEDICTCGQPLKDCFIWGRVLDLYSQIHGVDYSKKPLSMQLNIIDKIGHANRSIDRKIIRELYAQINASSFNSHLKRAFWLPYKNRIKRNLSFFDCVHQVTSCDWLVDSTKDIVRYAALKSQCDHLKPIILIRDAKGIASSAIKWNIDPVRYLDAWLKMYNQRIMPILARDIEEVLVISYDELAANFQQVRSDIASYLQVELTQPPGVLRGADYHLVAGNPMRFKKEIKIEYDASWKKRLNDNQIKLAQSYNNRLHPRLRQVVDKVDELIAERYTHAD